MSQRMKIGGKWQALDMFLRVKGSWKPSIAAYIKVNGTWKLVQHIHSFIYVSNDLETHTGTCAHCGQVTASVHSYVIIKNVEPTCTVDGEKIYLCDTCNQRKTVVEKAGHIWVDGAYNPPTCTSAGSGSRTCTRCGSQDSEVYPALGHDWYTTDTQEATCTEPAGYYEGCSRCTATRFERTADALGHAWVLIDTHEQDGHLWETYECSVCGASEIREAT